MRWPQQACNVAVILRKVLLFSGGYHVPKNTSDRTTRNLTPPYVAKKYGVATAKIIGWIRNGELKAVNLANRGCKRPRYSIPPEALEEFERSRQVVPDGGLSATQRLRRKAQSGTREYV